MPRRNSTHQAEMMSIIEAWKAQGGTWPASAAEIADFAIRRRLYNIHARARQLCARDLAKAMREEYITDAHGRPVRKLHAATVTRSTEGDGSKQLTLWADIDTAEREFMEVAFQQRRQQIVGDCRQLHNDVEYYNIRHPGEQSVQMWFDFTDDVAEGDMPDEY